MIFVAAFNFYRDSVKIGLMKKQELLATENKIQETFGYLLRQKDYNSAELDLKQLLGERIFEIANINNVSITFYDLQGNVIISSKYKKGTLNPSILNDVKFNKKKISEEVLKEDRKVLVYNSFTYLLNKNIPVAIIDTETIANKSSLFYHILLLIKQFFLAILFLFILSGYVAWVISKSLTKKIESVAASLGKTNVEYLETPIEYTDNDEIKPLVDSYNNMLVKLKEQTHVLAKTEREEAWRDMARQIAHEINNPLTPLKLSVQNFQRKYNAGDANNEEKIKNLTQMVVNQIDILSSITKAFSDFAKMPVNNDKLIDVVQTVKYAVDIFPDHIIEFSSNINELFYKIDNTYLTRIITNLVKNGIQSIPHNHKKVIVKLEDNSHNFTISIQDNGSGVSEENKDRLFEKKFTTKSTGMGLGLYMVKKIIEDYGGEIWFETEIDKGTTFFIEFNKNILKKTQI